MTHTIRIINTDAPTSEVVRCDVMLVAANVAYAVIQADSDMAADWAAELALWDNTLPDGLTD